MKKANKETETNINYYTNLENLDNRRSYIIKKIAIRLGIILAIGLIMFCGYDIYCHYTVTQFYKYIDAGDMDKSLAYVEKMPDVNTLEMCQPWYLVFGIFTGGSGMTGYPLYHAVSHNADISIIRALLEKGADPNRIDFEMESLYPLFYICKHPSKDMYEKVMLLVDYGADLDKGYLYIPAPFARLNEETKESMFLTIIYFWENGAEEWRYLDTKYECTVLHEAAESMDIEYFQEFYYNEKRPLNNLLNAQDANGDTALFRAIRSKMFDNCNFLIEEGADISIRNNEGKTAYDVAVELGYGGEIEGLQ